MLKSSAVHKDGDKYIHNVRNGRLYDRAVVDPNEVYMIERYYCKNKSPTALRHMVVKIKNAIKLCYEKDFCIIYRICEEIDTQTSKYLLNAELQLLESNKPHTVYEELVTAAHPFTTLSQSEEPRNLKQIQNEKYLIQKKTKDNEKVHINRFFYGISVT